jgi:hypothetical protein
MLQEHTLFFFHLYAEMPLLGGGVQQQKNALQPLLVTVIVNHDHVQDGIRDAGILALHDFGDRDGELPWSFRRMTVAKHINTMGHLVHLFKNAQLFLQR